MPPTLPPCGSNLHISGHSSSFLEDLIAASLTCTLTLFLSQIVIISSTPQMILKTIPTFSPLFNVLQRPSISMVLCLTLELPISVFTLEPSFSSIPIQLQLILLPKAQQSFDSIWTYISLQLLHFHCPSSSSCHHFNP